MTPRTRIICGLAVLALVATAALATAQEQTIRVETTAQERATLVQMCELARWASRYQFDATCDNLRKKLADAEQAAAVAAAAASQKKDDAK